VLDDFELPFGEVIELGGHALGGGGRAAYVGPNQTASQRRSEQSVSDRVALMPCTTWVRCASLSWRPLAPALSAP